MSAPPIRVRTYWAAEPPAPSARPPGRPCAVALRPQPIDRRSAAIAEADSHGSSRFGRIDHSARVAALDVFWNTTAHVIQHTISRTCTSVIQRTTSRVSTCGAGSRGKVPRVLEHAPPLHRILRLPACTQACGPADPQCSTAATAPTDTHTHTNAFRVRACMRPSVDSAEVCVHRSEQMCMFVR